MSTGVVWFRNDLRLGDNPAWAAATSSHDQVQAAFVIDPGLWSRVHPRRRALLAGHLRSLDADLRRRGGALWVGHGDPAAVIPALVRKLGAGLVHANRDVSPYAVTRDTAVATMTDIAWQDGRFVQAPGRIRTVADCAYTVFSPFYRKWSTTDWEPWPQPGPAVILAGTGDGIPPAGPPPIEPGEAAALGRLERFGESVDDYHVLRNRLDLDRTSRLSIDLKWGTLSPRTAASETGSGSEGRAAWLRQLAWRDFYAQVMAEMPHTATEPLRPEYYTIPWRADAGAFEAWTAGRTGYPLVDAGMRQLLSEGWMHNRVRMVAASFLVKDLLIDWRRGEQHFRRHLLDADVPQNAGNWQWVAGTGADATPYFRIFNPITQSAKFDPDGDYIRRWIPELGHLPAPDIHTPWKAGLLAADYPPPIVDHSTARAATLDAYASARNS